MITRSNEQAAGVGGPHADRVGRLRFEVEHGGRFDRAAINAEQRVVGRSVTGDQRVGPGVLAIQVDRAERAGHSSDRRVLGKRFGVEPDAGHSFIDVLDFDLEDLNGDVSFRVLA